MSKTKTEFTQEDWKEIHGQAVSWRNEKRKEILNKPKEEWDWCEVQFMKEEKE
jgi:hypothetical protein